MVSTGLQAPPPVTAVDPWALANLGCGGREACEPAAPSYIE